MKKTIKLLSILITAVITICTVNIPYTAETADFPKLISAKALDAGSIKIRWSRYSDSDALYAIYRKEKDQKFKIYDFSLAKKGEKQSYTDNDILSGRNYTYTVGAVPQTSFEDCLCYTSMSAENDRVTVKLSWSKPDTLKVYRYAVLMNGELAVLEKGSTRKAVYTLPYTKQLNDLDFEVYAISKTNLSNHDAKGLSAKTVLKKSIIKGSKLVADNKIRIDWTKSKGATGYFLYRKNTKNGKYKKIATLYGDSQTYCHTKIAKNKNYWYTVKAYSYSNKETVTAKYDKSGTAVKYKKVTVKPNKRVDSANVYFKYGLNNAQLKEVRKAAKSFFRKYITSDMSEVEKILTAQIYLAYSGVYGYDFDHLPNTAWGALVYKNKSGMHEANCYGYTMAMCALCDAMGISCRPVYHSSKASNPNHLWCTVKIDKKWYILDPQVNANYGVFSYFLISGKTYETETGETWDKSKYPTLSKTDYPQEKITQASYSYKVNNVF